MALENQAGTRGRELAEPLNPLGSGEEGAGNDDDAPRRDPGVQAERQAPRQVFVCFSFESLYKIDSVAQRFDIGISYTLRWLEDTPGHVVGTEEDSSWSPENFTWKPEVRIANMVQEGYQCTVDRYKVYPCGTDLGQPLGESLTPGQYWLERATASHRRIWVTCFRREIATLQARMSLSQFPFDVQRLTVTLGSSWDSSMVVLVFDDKRRNANQITAASETSIQDWDLYDPFLVADGRERDGDLPVLTEAKWSQTGVRYSRLHVQLLAQRQSHPWIFNFISIQFILTTLVFATFRMDPVGQLNDRLSVDTALVFSTIAFKQVVGGEIPKVALLTWLDKYLLWSFAFLIVVICCHLLEWKHEVQLVSVLAVAWAVINAGFFCLSCRYRRSNRRLIHDASRSFNEGSCRAILRLEEP